MYQQTHVDGNMASKEVLSETHLGFKLKPMQREVLSQLLKQENIFAILPTGYGKSVCYGLYIHIMRIVSDDS